MKIIKEIKKRIPLIARWKRIVLMLIAVLFLVRIGYIAFRAEVDKAYFLSCTYDLSLASPVPCTNVSETFVAKEDKLDSLELVFSGIADDKAGTVAVCIFSEDTLIYQTNVKLENMNNSEWRKILVGAPLKKGKTYKITLNANGDCTQIPNVLMLDSGYASEIKESFANGQKAEGNIAVNFGYLHAGIFDRIVIISLWMILYAFIFLIIINIEKIIAYFSGIKKVLMAGINRNVFRYVLELVCCLVIVNCSGIEFQEMTKVIFYVISLIAVTNFDKKKAYITGILNKTWKRVLLVCVYLYAAFALVGHRAILYPLTLRPTVHGVFVLLCAAIWFIPVVNSLLFYIEKAAKNVFGKPVKIKTWLFIILNVMILILPAAYNLIANNPAISSPDTADSMIANAQHLHGMYDWHPAFYCMILRGIEEIWNSTYPVIGVQYFFWAYVVIELMLYLRKKGLSDIVLIIASAFFGLNASNFIHLNTIWKDIPYTLSIFWTFVIVAKLAIDYEEYKGKWYIYLELIVALVGDFFFRKNGMVSFAVVAVVLLVFLRKNIKVLVSLLISVALIGVIKGPVYSYFEVEDPGKRGIYHGLGQDILGAYYNGGEVSESTLQMIKMMTLNNIAEYDYNPTWSNQSYDVTVEPKTFIFNYIDTFFKNPVLMTRAVIAREDAMWDIYAGQDAMLGCVNYTGTMDGEANWNDYYSTRKYKSLTADMTDATAYTANTQWISAIEWRAGLFSLIGVICTIWCIIRYGKGKHLVFLAPIGAHIMSLLLTTGWSDFRYFWPLNLLNFSLLLLTIALLHLKRCEKKNDETIGLSEETA